MRLETAAVAAFPVVEITDCIHSRDNSFQHVPECAFCHDSLPVWAQATQSSITKLDVLSIPCTSPAAVERSYYITLWHRKLATVSRHNFLSLSLLSPEIRKIQLAIARYCKLDHK